jgi:hypothetical protein
VPLSLNGCAVSGGVFLGALPYSNGLYYRRYSGYFADDVNWFATATQTAAGVNTSPITDEPTGELFSIQWLGWFLATTTETYTFFTTSDDASYLWIGATALSGFTTANATVNNGGLHGSQERSGTANLISGTYYPIRIQFGENTGGDVMEVRISTATIAKTTDLSANIFYNIYTTGF